MFVIFLDFPKRVRRHLFWELETEIKWVEMFVCLMWGIYYKNLARTPEIVWHCFCCCCWCCCSLHELIYCCCRLSFIFHYLVAATFFYTIEMHVYFIHIVFVVVFVFCIHNMNTDDDCDDDSSGFFPKSNKTETKTKT